MTSNDLFMIAWLVGGVVFGLAGANMVWKDPGATGSTGLDAFLIFIGGVVAAPLVAAGLVLAAVSWCGAWLLPAFRARKRAERAQRRHLTE